MKKYHCQQNINHNLEDSFWSHQKWWVDNVSVGYKTEYIATAEHSPHLFQISFHIGQSACFSVCILATHSLNAILAFGNTITNPSDTLTTDNFTQSITIIRRLTEDTVSLLTEHSSPEGNLHLTHWLVKSS